MPPASMIQAGNKGMRYFQPNETSTGYALRNPPRVRAAPRMLPRYRAAVLLASARPSASARARAVARARARLRVPGLTRRVPASARPPARLPSRPPSRPISRSPPPARGVPPRAPSGAEASLAARDPGRGDGRSARQAQGGDRPFGDGLLEVQGLDREAPRVQPGRSDQSLQGARRARARGRAPRAAVRAARAGRPPLPGPRAPSLRTARLGTGASPWRSAAGGRHSARPRRLLGAPAACLLAGGWGLQQRWSCSALGARSWARALGTELTHARAPHPAPAPAPAARARAPRAGTHPLLLWQHQRV